MKSLYPLTGGLAGLMLASCAYAPDAYMSSPGQIAALAGTPGLGVATRQFAGPKTYLAPMPTAVVLLREGQARNTTFCEHYRSLVDDLGEQDDRGGMAPNMVLTRWLLAAPQLAASPDTCADMLLGYDYQRATALLEAFTPAPGAPAVGAYGPYIMQFLPNGAVILVDGSTVTNDELQAWTAGWILAAKAQATAIAPAASVDRPPVPPSAARAASANPGPEAAAAAPGSPPAQAQAQAQQEAESEQPWWNRARDGLLTVVEENVPYGRVIVGSLRWFFGTTPAPAQPAKPQPA